MCGLVCRLMASALCRRPILGLVRAARAGLRRLPYSWAGFYIGRNCRLGFGMRMRISAGGA